MKTRQIAAKVLTCSLKQGQSLTTALDQTLPDIASAQDRAFIQALCYGTLRQFHRLDFILQQLLQKPLKDEEVKALLLIGLYQLHFMRVKPHAAVSETVAALSKKKHHAKPLINAILRNYLRQKQDLEAAADQNPSAAAAHPKWLIRQLKRSWPEHYQDIMRENNQQAPMVLRVNTRQNAVDDYLHQLAEHGLAGEKHICSPTAIVLQQAVAVEKLPGFVAGHVSVQDTAAQLAALLLDAQAGQRVLDVCAAPGGKTAHILESEPNLAHVLAVDVAAQRIARVKETLQRLNLTAEVQTGNALNANEWWDGVAFDRILLDAPCSATGVIRRHPDIKLLRREQDIAPLQQLQQQILHAMWPLLAAQGIMLYATCSVLKDENEQQIQAFLATHPDAEEINIEADWGRKRAHGRQILPGDLKMDGFYYAKIRKL